MRLRAIAAAVMLVVSAGCARGRAPSGPAVAPPSLPSPPSAMGEAHFVAEDGSPLPTYEPVWAFLRTFYGAAMPARVTIVLVDGTGGHFDTERSQIVLGRDELKVSGPALVAHETSHLCLAVVTRGASATEAFRFLDEGFASILEARIAGRGADYEEEAFAIAALELAKGRASFDLLQRWSEYFGDWQGRSSTRDAGSPHDFDAYRVASSFELWVRRNHGEGALRHLFVAVGTTRDLNQALAEALGKPAADVEAEWKAYLASVKVPDDTPSVVNLVPADGATDVSTTLPELTVHFSTPMNRSIVNLGANCDLGVCFTNASWTSPTVLTVRLPDGLKPATSYTVTLGVEGHPLRSRYGRDLPVRTWRFGTRPQGT